MSCEDHLNRGAVAQPLDSLISYFSRGSSTGGGSTGGELEIVHLALSAELSKELTDHYNRR